METQPQPQSSARRGSTPDLLDWHFRGLHTPLYLTGVANRPGEFGCEDRALGVGEPEEAESEHSVPFAVPCALTGSTNAIHADDSALVLLCQAADWSLGLPVGTTCAFIFGLRYPEDGGSHIMDGVSPGKLPAMRQ
ncbi:hypothetical protein N7532_000945 [Penicillium argentinense]|uniref:Uncharacterized protein n=1 Tax=Penicillium argentinense TaxID=1131581 RepID=A0A9W9G1L0_9EURO|nr:uncharacterized protein N7532_000945 [Penicillium argentinense]KAJ5110410.1 hypothetical protein N7532_000945 [Penicillium argentinense]